MWRQEGSLRPGLELNRQRSVEFGGVCEWSLKDRARELNA